MFRSRLLASLFAVTAAAISSGQIIWNEGSNGDLSNNRLAPTSLSLGLGVNGLIATTGNGDIDYVHFHLNAGLMLSSIVVISWDGSDQIGFIGVQAGTTFTEPSIGTDPANLLGYTHFGPGVGNVGQDILPSIGTGPGSQGFTPPLTGADYTFWLNQVGGAVTYRLDFVTSPVPEPATLAVLGLGLALARRRRR